MFLIVFCFWQFLSAMPWATIQKVEGYSGLCPLYVGNWRDSLRSLHGTFWFNHSIVSTERSLLNSIISFLSGPKKLSQTRKSTLIFTRKTDFSLATLAAFFPSKNVFYCMFIANLFCNSSLTHLSHRYLLKNICQPAWKHSSNSRGET